MNIHAQPPFTLIGDEAQADHQFLRHDGAVVPGPEQGVVMVCHQAFYPEAKILMPGGFTPPEQMKCPGANRPSGGEAQKEGHDLRRVLLFGTPEGIRTSDLPLRRTLMRVFW